MTHNPLTVFPITPVEAGEGGKSGAFQISNADFIAAVFPHLPDGAYAVVCSKAGISLPIDKSKGGTL